MGGIKSFVVAAAALGLVLASAPPAGAAPSPRSDEWWFPPWAVSDLWQTTRGAGVTVAVLDGGVNGKVPELSGAVVSGGDVIGRGTDGRTDFDKKNDGHGTAMAALIAARGGGRSGFVGIAPESKILPVTVMDTQQVRSPQRIADGIRYATDHGAKVISISLSVQPDIPTMACPAEVQNAVAYAIDRDALVVAAAGNDAEKGNGPLYPAACGGVLAVGAIDNRAEPWKGSERQSYVAVAGPGVRVGWVGQSGRYYPDGWGTSQATALVAGGLALVRAAQPKMPVREIVQRVIATAKDIGDPGVDQATGYGVPRLFRVMTTGRYPVPANAPNPVFDRFDKWRAVASPAPAPDTPTPKKSGGSSATPFVVIAIVVLAGVVLILWRRARRRPAEDDPYESGEPGRQGDPPPGAGARRDFYPQDDRPPRGGVRPDFLPPSDGDSAKPGQMPPQ